MRRAPRARAFASQTTATATQVIKSQEFGRKQFTQQAFYLIHANVYKEFSLIHANLILNKTVFNSFDSRKPCLGSLLF